MKLAEIRAGAENEPIFWTCDEDAETLSQTDKDEAIAEHLDNFWLPPYEYKDRDAERVTAFLALLPNEMSVYGFSRTKVAESDLDADAILEASVGRLEEDEWGDPDGRTWDERMNEEQIKAIKDAAANLIQVIVQKYVPWSCDRVVEEKFDPKAWIAEHCPEWLDTDAHKAGIV